MCQDRLPADVNPAPNRGAAISKIQRFLALADRFPDAEVMWMTGGIALTWGDLRWLAFYPPSDPADVAMESWPES